MPFDSHCEPQIEQFFKTIAHWRDGLATERLQFVAVEEQGRFSVFAARFVLMNAKDTAEDRLFQADRVWAGDLSGASLEISPEQFVEELGQGKLRTPLGLLNFPGAEGRHRAFFQKYHPQGLAVNSRGTMLQITGGHIGNPLADTDLDWELKASPVPYQNVFELMVEFGVSGVARNDATVEVLALPATVFDVSSSMSGAIARPAVHLAKGLTTEHFRLGVIQFMHGRPTRRFSVEARDFVWQDIGASNKGTVEISVPEGSALCCVASYLQQAHAIHWLIDPATAHNPRRAAYSAFDSGLFVLSENIVRDEIRKGDARDFEAAVCALFWMLGFSGANIGAARRTSEAPDLIFNTPDGHFAVIECTTGNLKSGNKLTNLVERVEKVRAALKSSGSQHLRVLSVLVTCATRESIKADLDQAENLGVYVIARDELVALIQQTIVPSNPNQLFENAEKQAQSRQPVIGTKA